MTCMVGNMAEGRALEQELRAYIHTETTITRQRGC